MEIASFPAIKLSHDFIAQEKAKRKEKAVPARLEWTETKDLRIHIPHRMMHLKTHDIIFDDR